VTKEEKVRKGIASIGLGVLVLCGVAGVLLAQNRVYHFNGVSYVFPASQGLAGHVLTNDGTGELSWSAVPTPEGLWTGAVVLSQVACPAGWTRLAAADNRLLRAAATGGGTGGADTHTHTISGTSGAQAVTISGSTSGSGASVSGSTGSTSIAHSHGVTTSTSGCGSGSNSALTSVSINSGDASHSHSSGTLSCDSHSHGTGSLAGASHTHGAGSFAAASTSNVPAYFEVVVCVKN
jgi:hypothetical protein